MKRFAALLTFAAGCSTGMMLFWTRADLRAEGPSAIHVCASGDGVLRLATESGCPAAQTSLYLPGPGAQQTGDGKPKTDSASRQKVADLERHIAELEKAGGVKELPHTAEAPFEVKDRSGNVVLRVDQKTVSLFTRAKPVMQMLASDDGGRFKARSATVDMDVSLLAEGKTIGVVVNEAGTTRTRLGTGEDKYTLTIHEKSGNMVAGIGQEQATTGSGAVVVGDQAGVMKAGLQVIDRRGMVAVESTARVGVAILNEGVNGGGHLQIAGPDRQVMVEAGVAKEGYGIVRAGPAAFAPGYGVLGLPGSYIMGKE
jgi:hypothetical protein